LVKDGYVERRADPEDGRASLLVVTARGDAVYQEHRRLRNEHYQKMLAEWSEEECRVFVQLTTRFTDGIDQSWPVWFKNDTALPAAGRGPTNQHREA
jgi:DNA-binding MarR family transcriptional regulator